MMLMIMILIKEVKVFVQNFRYVKKEDEEEYCNVSKNCHKKFSIYQIIGKIEY